MTLSNRTRLEFLNTALQRMREDLADHWISEMRFEINSERYNDLPPTTWLDLQQQTWVKTDNYFGNPAFKLTGSGLIAAMKHTGELQSEEHKERCVRLRAAFKDVVKGREISGGRTDTSELTAKTDLSASWIFNAIDARFLAKLWPHDHVDVESRYGGRDIKVPANFGTQRLSGLEAGPLALIPE
ncbi:MAG: hypothetical protein Q8T13_20015 [Acidobacteriota bacterium]|nr:hypothetical protein [Acidobacteriota bacterium]